MAVNARMVVGAAAALSVFYATLFSDQQTVWELWGAPDVTPGELRGGNLVVKWYVASLVTLALMLAILLNAKPATQTIGKVAQQALIVNYAMVLWPTYEGVQYSQGMNRDLTPWYGNVVMVAVMVGLLFTSSSAALKGKAPAAAPTGMQRNGLFVWAGTMMAFAVFVLVAPDNFFAQYGANHHMTPEMRPAAMLFARFWGVSMLTQALVLLSVRDDGHAVARLLRSSFILTAPSTAANVLLGQYAKTNNMGAEAEQGVLFNFGLQIVLASALFYIGGMGGGAANKAKAS